MLFDKYFMGPLMDEATEGNPGGGGNPEGGEKKEGAPAPDFGKILSDIQGLLDKNNKTLNAYEKKFRGMDETIKNLNNQRQQEADERKKREEEDRLRLSDEDAAKKPESHDAQRYLANIRNLENRVKQQEDVITKEQQAREQAEKRAIERETDAQLRTALASYTFPTEVSKNDLYTILRPRIARTDEGDFVGPDDLPLDEWIKQEINARPNYIPAKQVNGAGAVATGGRSGKALDTDDIKPGMSPEERAKFWAAINTFMSQAQQ